MNKKRIISAMTLIVCTIIFLGYNAYASNNNNDNTNKDRSAQLGTEENPYVILEVVPDEAYAEIGYLVGGQEPINLNETINISDVDLTNAQDIIKSVDGALSVDMETENELSVIKTVGTINNIGGNNSLDIDTEETDGYYINVGNNNGSWKANYYLNGSSTNITSGYFAQSWETASNIPMNTYNYVYIINKKQYYKIIEDEYGKVYRKYNNEYISKDTDIESGIDTSKYDYAYKKLKNTTNNEAYVLISNISTDRYRRVNDYKILKSFEYVGSGNGDWEFYPAYTAKNYKLNNETFSLELNKYTESEYYLQYINIYNTLLDMGIGTRVSSQAVCNIGKSDVVKFEFINNELFKKNVLGITNNKQLKDYVVKVIVKTPNELNTDILDNCDLVYFNDGGEKDSYRYSKIVELYKKSNNLASTWVPKATHLTSDEHDEQLDLSIDFINKLYSLILFGDDKITYSKYTEDNETTYIENINEDRKPVIIFDSAMYDNIIKNYEEEIVYNNMTKLYILCNEMYPTVYYKNFIKPYFNEVTSESTTNTIDLSKLHVGKTYFEQSEDDTLVDGINKHMLWPLSINDKYDDPSGYKQMGIDNQYLSEKYVVEHNILSFNSNSDKNILFAISNVNISNSKTTEEAFLKLSENKIISYDKEYISFAQGLMYLIKYQMTNNIIKPTLDIIDIEPCNSFTTEELWQWKICGFAPYYLGTMKPFDTVTSQMATNQFIGVSKDINESYDLIYIGDNTLEMNNALSGNDIFRKDYYVILNVGESTSISLDDLLTISKYNSLNFTLSSTSKDKVISYKKSDTDNTIQVNALSAGVETISLSASVKLSTKTITNNVKFKVYVVDTVEPKLNTSGELDSATMINDIQASHSYEATICRLPECGYIKPGFSLDKPSDGYKYYSYEYLIKVNSGDTYTIIDDNNNEIEYYTVGYDYYSWHNPGSAEGTQRKFLYIEWGNQFSDNWMLENSYATFTNGWSGTNRDIQTTQETDEISISLRTTSLDSLPESISIKNKNTGNIIATISLKEVQNKTDISLETGYYRNEYGQIPGIKENNTSDGNVYYTYNYVIGAEKYGIYRIGGDYNPNIEYSILEVTDYSNGYDSQFTGIKEGEIYEIADYTDLYNKKLYKWNILGNNYIIGFDSTQKVFRTSGKAIGFIINVKLKNGESLPEKIKIEKLNVTLPENTDIINKNKITKYGDIVSIARRFSDTDIININGEDINAIKIDPKNYINTLYIQDYTIESTKLYKVESDNTLESVSNITVNSDNSIIIKRSSDEHLLLHLYLKYTEPEKLIESYSSIFIEIISDMSDNFVKIDPYSPIYNDESLSGLIYMHIGDKYNIKQEIEADGYFDGALQKNGNSDIENGLIAAGSDEGLYDFDTRFSGNDITKKRMNDLEDFLDASLPIVVADSLLVIDENGKITGANSKTVDNSSYLYEFIENNKDRLIYSTQSISNIWYKAFSKNITLNVNEKPLIYYNDSTDVDDSVYLQNRELKFEIELNTPIIDDQSNYAVDLYIDGNCDGMFSQGERIYGLSILNSSGNIINAKRLKANSGYYTISRVIPEQYIGVINWKLLIYKVNNTTIRNSIEGVSALKTSEETRPDIAVLQILPCGKQSASPNTQNSANVASDAVAMNTDGTLYKYRTKGSNNIDDRFYSYVKNVQDFNINCISRTELDLIDDEGNIKDILAYKVTTQIYNSDMLIPENRVTGSLKAADQTFTLSRIYYPNGASLEKDTVTLLENVNTLYTQGTELISLEEAESTGYDYTNYLAQGLLTEVEGEVLDNNGTKIEEGTYYVYRYIQGVGFDEIYDYDNGNINISEDSEVLGFDMLMTGMADACVFSRSAEDPVVNESVLDKIIEHNEQGKTLLLTHDTIPFSTLKGSVNDETDENYQYGYIDFYKLKDIACIDRYSNDIAWLPNTNREETVLTQGWTNISILGQASKRQTSSDFNPWNDQYVPYFSHGKVSAQGPWHCYEPFLSEHNRNVAMIKFAEVVNRGQITEYPYHIPDTIQVAPTHYQYWQLDLEQDVAVWMTLKQTRGDEPYSEDCGGYKNFNRDTRNNYYIYSKDNVVYTGLGHCGGITDDEMKLFVNTIVSSYRNKSTGSNLVVDDSDASVYGADTYIYIDSDYDDIDKDISLEPANDQKLRFNIIDNNLVTNSKITLEIADAKDGVKVNDINVKNFTSMTTPLKELGVNDTIDIYEYSYDISNAVKLTPTETGGYNMSVDSNYYFSLPQDIIEWAAQELAKNNSNSYVLYARITLGYNSKNSSSINYERKVQSMQRIIFIKRGLFMMD